MANNDKNVAVFEKCETMEDLGSRLHAADAVCSCSCLVFVPELP